MRKSLDLIEVTRKTGSETFHENGIWGLLKNPLRKSCLYDKKNAQTKHAMPSAYKLAN